MEGDADEANLEDVRKQFFVFIFILLSTLQQSLLSDIFESKIEIFTESFINIAIMRSKTV